jgi:glutamine amidotransferase
MQALFDASEEGGTHECLGVLPGRIVRFPEGLTVPHMGWNNVHVREAHPAFDGIAQDAYFYFVHSYYPRPNDDSHVIAEAEYGGIRFAAVVGRDNLIATQFHPEKSGADGLRLYANFLRLALEHGSIAPQAVAASTGPA